MVTLWAMIAGWSTMANAIDESASAKSSTADQIAEPTHRQTRMITPKLDGESVTLHTMATTADGHIVAALGGYTPSYEMTSRGMQMKVIKQPAAVVMLSSKGETLKRWDLEITPTALAVAPSGTIFVGGSGKLLRLANDGTVEKSVTAPHVTGDAEQDDSDTRSGAPASANQQLATLQKRIDVIEAKDPDDRTRLEEAQRKAFSRQLDALKKLLGVTGAPQEDDNAEAMPSAMQLRREMVTSMAASDESIFIVAIDPSVRGYSIWKMNADLNPKSSEMILDGLSGCCGQMDIQCCQDKLLVSENTKFKVGIYDHFGRRQGSFGKRDRTSREGFGSCCNPMNSLGMSDGTILTAESSIGHIKRFDTEGNLVAYVGKASIGGGCKHCSLGFDPQKDIYYMMYEDKNAICVMEKSDGTATEQTTQLASLKADRLLPLLGGSWKVDQDANDSQAGLAASSLPITAMTIKKNGTVSIDEGLYQAIGTDTQLELLPSDGDSPKATYSIGLVNDQVRMIEMTWAFQDVDQASVDFGRGMVLKMNRTSKTPEGVTIESVAQSCGPDCDGKTCGNPACESQQHPSLPPSEFADLGGAIREVTQAQQMPKIAAVALPPSEGPPIVEAVPLVPSMKPKPSGNLSLSRSAPTTTFEYKVIGQKKLGLDPQASLNKLGASGWELCGNLGKKLVFKRIARATSSQIPAKGQVEALPLESE